MSCVCMYPAWWGESGRRECDRVVGWSRLAASPRISLARSLAPPRYSSHMTILLLGCTGSGKTSITRRLKCKSVSICVYVVCCVLYGCVSQSGRCLPAALRGIPYINIGYMIDCTTQHNKKNQEHCALDLDTSSTVSMIVRVLYCMGML